MSENWFNLNKSLYDIQTKAPTRTGEFPITEDMLRNAPSGNLFGMSQDAGMGWEGKRLRDGQVLILTTLGGLRADDGTPLALGYHTGHWELGLLVKAAAQQFKEMGCLPFAGHCSDPCDGRTQGTLGMMDSLAYRNSASEVLGRLIRSLPSRKAVMGIATCDKGLPAMMMGLAENADLPGIIVPGGVSLAPETGEDAGRVQSIGTRFSHGEISLKEASALGCAACGTPGGGCQFLGTAATSQVIGEALGISLPHSALAPSGQQIWLEMAIESAKALKNLMEQKINLNHIITEDALHNAMVVHASMGGSSNLLLHLPAIVRMAGVKIPDVAYWEEVNRSVPRIVDVLPNGPQNFTTVQLFLAGGVPETMLHLRDAGLLRLNALTVTGKTLGENLKDWETSERRTAFRACLLAKDGVEPDDVIMGIEKAAELGLARTLVFPKGNLAPEGSVVKSTAISADLFKDGVYRHRGPAKVFTNEVDAIRALKDSSKLSPGDVILLICRGPIGAGMPETSQITMAMKYTKSLQDNVLLTDGRFSGFSSGPCIGHIGPEALAGGPISKIENGDIIEVFIDNNNLKGSVDLIGLADTPAEELSVELGDKILAERNSRTDLQADPKLPASVRLWAALQQTGGGVWGGCVPDIDEVIRKLKM
ncbi:MAG: YjhG/YagF family D-xylonate dehydratase [Flavobacteriales bacterium]|nr:YjhG/YagF family D-xylonate dehydratase [Flavobacteriales bacterium]